MTTTTQCPPVGRQVSACVPGPAAFAVQIREAVGGVVGAAPCARSLRMWPVAQFVTTWRSTPARYVSTALCGATPMNRRFAGLVLVARMRTVPRMSPGVTVSAELPRSIPSLVTAYEAVLKLRLSLVRYPAASRWVFVAHVAMPPAARRPRDASPNNEPITSETTRPPVQPRRPGVTAVVGGGGTVVGSGSVVGFGAAVGPTVIVPPPS